MDDPTLCAHCGAPRQTGLVACSYCDQPYPGAPAGVDCPRCGDDNATSQLRCASCGTSLLRPCLFCHSKSSVRFEACQSCGEVFEGAEARLAEHREEERRRQLLQTAATGASLLGAAALGAGAGRGLLGSLVDGLVDAVDGDDARPAPSRRAGGGSTPFLKGGPGRGGKGGKGRGFKK